MDFTNFVILYLLIVVQVGGYFWLQKAARNMSRYQRVYQYIFDSYMMVGLVVMAVFEMVVLALR